MTQELLDRPIENNDTRRCRVSSCRECFDSNRSEQIEDNLDAAVCCQAFDQRGTAYTVTGH
jgi:hypothetical protein